MPGSDEKEDSPKPSGRVRHDKGGRAIWEWAKDSGRYALDSTSRLLQRLDLSGLKLEEDAKREAEEQQAAAGKTPDGESVPTFGGEREQDPAGPRRSFDPYNSRAAPTRGVAKKPGKPAPRITQPPARPTGKPGLLARLFGRGR